MNDLDAAMDVILRYSPELGSFGVKLCQSGWR